MKIAVYAHMRYDTGKIFYIGKGTDKRSKSKNNRNLFWRNIVNKSGGFKTEILAHWNTEQEAFEHEKLLIYCFRKMGYVLANLTDGGEGTTGFKWAESSRLKLSKSKTGIKFSTSHKNNVGIARLGKKHSEKTIERMKEIRKNGTANSIKLTVCGVEFQSLTNFAKYVNKTPAWIKKCFDKNRVEKLEEYYKNAAKKTKDSGLFDIKK